MITREGGWNCRLSPHSGVESFDEFGEAEGVGKPDVSFIETESHKHNHV